MDNSIEYQQRLKPTTMTPEEKAKQYAELYVNPDHPNNSYAAKEIYAAYLAGFNADRWIPVTPETVAVEGGKYLVWVKHNYEDREEVIISKKLHTTNVYWTITHYQIITPPTK